MNKIKLMSEELANKIAAGEVCERPASVVKELVENAIDAGADEIIVHLIEGGLKSIQVIDNGCGMSPQDARDCFLRHATSKIMTEQDLFHISTLGFRGEAIPSIASVSLFTLSTSDGETGTEIVYSGGVLDSMSETHLKKGTSVSVKNLFYNTPARLKYMGSTYSEVARINALLNRLALSHSHIAFTLTSNQQTILSTDGSGLVQKVLHQIYGLGVSKELVSFENETSDFKIHGYLTKPTVNRANKNHITLILNGRTIRNFKVINAVVEAYHTFMPSNRYPLGVLFIELDPYLVDVNVHPSKMEVRISKEDELLELIRRTVRGAIMEKRNIPTVDLNRAKPSVIQTSFDLRPSAPVEVEATSDRTVDLKPVPKQNIPLVQDEKCELPPEKMDESEVEDMVLMDNEPETKAETARFPYLDVIGQIHGTYIVASSEDGMYLVDQHAAMERVMYEKYYRNLSDNRKELTDLLIPMTLEFRNDEAILVKNSLDKIHEYGISIEVFGINTFIVRSHPHWFSDGLEVELVKELIDTIISEKKIGVSKLREELAINMSCKHSIKANQHLRQEEMVHLLQDLSLCDHPFTCPHGRPILVHFSSYDLEKMFKRVM